ncbi:hypothetical protein AAG747_05435 [Rapidithrix thailandica]|uniref:Uncharacterized protein n=1 Tax=Rapidithrix thailandica TaxID=413964 RepID=A0AAW9S4P6_9BACT
MKTKKLLLVGRRKEALDRLVMGLTWEGYTVEGTVNVEEVLTNYVPSQYDLVAFGAGVGQKNKQLLKNFFNLNNPNILLLDCPLPVFSLIMDQIKYAFDNQWTKEEFIEEFSYEINTGVQVTFCLKKECNITIRFYQFNHLNGDEHITNILTGFLKEGEHHYSLPSEGWVENGRNVLGVQAGSQLALFPIEKVIEN